MELRHLRYFITLAEELHFGRAAKRLYISQPPLSRQIKELEEELGAVLFLRNNRRVTLTEAGRFFFHEASEMLRRLQLAQQLTNRIHGSFAGDVKIGYISSTDKSKLGRLVQEIQRQYPFVQTKLFELSTKQQIKALEDRQMDFGIIRGPNYSAKLQTERLYEDGFVLAIPRGMPLPEDLAQLSRQPFVSYHANYAPIYHSQMIAYCAKLGFTPNLRHECNNVPSILELVHLGAGISVVPQSVQSQYAHLAVDFLNPSESVIRTDILLAYTVEPEHAAFSDLQKLILHTLKK